LGPFIATFFISVFVLLMQFLWKWIDDLVGKGLDFTVIAELLYYASISLIPMALPLAILLASIMTYGNLGEKFELTAIKAAGISLQRAMLPLTILTLIFSLGAFVIANDVIPYANLKMSALIWSIRNQRPELNIKPSIFNNDIEDFSIRISSKNEKTGMMYDFVVYDHTKGKVNNVCIVADSGSMKVTDDGRYMIVTLYSGVRYEEMDDKKKTSFPYQKDEFGEQSLVFNLAGFDFNKADESGFKNRYQVMNVSELAVSTDSLQRDFQKYANDLHESLTTTSYFRQSSHREKVYAEVAKIDCENLFYRNDIAHCAFE
jgi:lipopolysaccharide export system permease protein